MPSPRPTSSCAICSRTKTTRLELLRRLAWERNLRCCKPARQRWAGWQVADLCRFISVTSELLRYDSLEEMGVLLLKRKY